MEKIGDVICAYRNRNHLTQKELGQLCGMKQQSIDQIERGRRCPKLETVKRIADALNVKVEDVYKGVTVIPTKEEEPIKPVYDGGSKMIYMGAEIKSAMKQRGWKQKELMQATGLSRYTISAICNGKGCNRKTADKIAKSLGLCIVSPDDLFTDDGDINVKCMITILQNDIQQIEKSITQLNAMLSKAKQLLDETAK